MYCVSSRKYLILVMNAHNYTMEGPTVALNKDMLCPGIEYTSYVTYVHKVVSLYCYGIVIVRIIIFLNQVQECPLGFVAPMISLPFEYNFTISTIIEQWRGAVVLSVCLSTIFAHVIFDNPHYTYQCDLQNITHTACIQVILGDQRPK